MRVLDSKKITRLQFGVEYSRYSSYSAQPYILSVSQSVFPKRQYAVVAFAWRNHWWRHMNSNGLGLVYKDSSLHASHSQ
jgi:hypothetical protein